MMNVEKGKVYLIPPVIACFNLLTGYEAQSLAILPREQQVEGSERFTHKTLPIRRTDRQKHLTPA